MGNKNTKPNNSLLFTENLGQYSCRVTRNHDDQVQISPYQVKSQFGSRYVYFSLPKDFLKNNFETISVFYQNFSVTPNLTDSCLIIKADIRPVKNIVDKVEYLEYNIVTDRGGKFSLRVNQSNYNKSQLVYNNTIERS